MIHFQAYLRPIALIIQALIVSQDDSDSFYDIRGNKQLLELQ